MQKSFCPHCITPQVRDGDGDGLYRRLFPELPSAHLDLPRDLALGKAGGVMEADPEGAASDNPRIPAGWPFFGQIVAHDITRDRAPLQARAEVDGLRNFHTPRLDLECLYGDGPIGQPYFYDSEDMDKLLIGLNDRGESRDLPRNRQGVALIPDARNDTYLFISQLHLALMKFHNRLVDEVRESGAKNAFAEAQRLTRWHYQWLVVNEYLPLHVGEAAAETLLGSGSDLFGEGKNPFVPVEFAAGVFRFGHAQICNAYKVNDRVGDTSIFPDLVGQRQVPAELVPQWPRLFRFPDAPPPQPTKRLEATYAPAMMRLPAQLTGELANPAQSALAYRDLQRGASMDLPSGEAVAERLGVVPLSRDELALPEGLCLGGTPLPYYVLREAHIQHDGHHLGEVGGHVVAGVLLALLKADPTAYLVAEPGWQPILATSGERFGIADLLTAARVV